MPLFDMTVFDKLDLSTFKSLFKPFIDIKDPGSGLVVRPLRASDYNTGMFQHKQYDERLQQYIL